jgi:hypothetical protein
METRESENFASINLFEDFALTTPIMSAPLSLAALASLTRVIPQILMVKL